MDKRSLDKIEQIRLQIGDKTTNKIVLYNEVDRKFLPEVLATTLAQLKYNKIHNKSARAVMAHWTPSFSIAEKQRFLATAAHFTEFVDMCEFMDMLEYAEFDILMLLNPRGTDAVVRSLVGRLKEKGREIIAQIDSWMNFTIIDTLRILRQSAFMTPELEPKLMPRMHNKMLIKGARFMASHFRLPFPPKLVSLHFALNMRLVLKAFREEEMGRRDLAMATAELTGKEDALWELASMMAEDEKDATETLLQYREKGKRPSQTRRSVGSNRAKYRIALPSNSARSLRRSA